MDPIARINEQLRAAEERAALSEFALQLGQGSDEAGMPTYEVFGVRPGPQPGMTTVASRRRPLPDVIMHPELINEMIDEVEATLRLRD